MRRGNFTWHDGMQQWVWTTFNSFQWDLNYSNPAVFRAMLEEMFFIANTGVDILRLDAVAFIWKQMGTSCENLPEAHLLIQAFNRLARIATPGPAVQIGSDRASRRSRQVHQPARMPDLLQPDAHGPAVGIAGHAQSHAAAPNAAPSLPTAARTRPG